MTQPMHLRKPHRNPEYLDFVRSHRCCVTDSFWDVVAHHVRMGRKAGTGQKPSDYHVVPLTNERHNELHAIGERSFWEKTKVDPNIIIYSLLTEYIRDELNHYGKLPYDDDSLTHICLLEDWITAHDPDAG